MKVAFFLALLATSVAADEQQSNPLGKVFELMSALEAKIVKEGEAEAKAFKEFFEWCDSTSKNLNNDIKTGEKSKAKLTARIEEESSNIEVSETKIEELGAAISTNEAELKEATGIRDKESADFAASEKELVATVDTLDRALSIISSEMAKSGAALAQIDTSSMSNLLQSLSLIVDAAGFTADDHRKLVALVQQQQGTEDGDSEEGAPAAASYKSQSGGIVDLLGDLKEKAEAELAEARKAESTAKHNYALMKQSLEDQMAADNKEMDEQKSAKDAAAEAKATAEGDLSVTVEELKKNNEALATANSDCMTTAADHEATTAARTEELKVIATAEKILKESTGGAEGQTYLQVRATSKMHSRLDLANSEVVTLVKKLAQDHHSAALAQLASRIAVTMRYARNGGDPFEKVKGLISDMIMKLEKEAEDEATEKAYCDEQMSKTEAKKSELEDDIAKLTNGIDKAASRSASLKEEVTELEAELAALAKSQQEMDKVRAEQNANFKVAQAELTQGLAGVRKALTVLRDYYGGSAALIQDDKFSAFMQQPAPPEKHEKSSGAGGSIISILEVCESDFATNLSKEESEEADSAENYEKVTQENKVDSASKTQDAKYKTKEAAGLDKQISELSADRDTSNTELSAVMEYYGKVKERCVAKPESYEERKARREAEIDGLKDALEILENETAFMQRSKKGRSRRQRFLA